MEYNESELNKLVDKKIQLGKNLIQSLEINIGIRGVSRIQRKINQEVEFLNKVKSKGIITKNHIMCCNLTYYDFFIKVLQLQKNVTYVDCSFQIYKKSYPFRVDIICNNGAKWIKVIAKNTKSILDAVNGDNTYGQKNVIDQAKEYLSIASENLHNFKVPEIEFYFKNDLNKELTKKLNNMGIKVVIKVLLTLNPTNVSNLCENDSLENDLHLLNLDTTTLLAYVSQLTNSGCNFIFAEKILTEQASREKQNPVKSILDNLFKGKTLICCKSAVESFISIICTLGGLNEKQRALHFLSKIKIYPDITSEEIPKKFQSIFSKSKRIKLKSLKIFYFGVQMEAITVTANEGFIKTFEMQGIKIPNFIHQARALTEKKEETAIGLE